MGRSVEIEAPAKVNLFLEVLRKRPDGYHDLESVLETISLVDRVSVRLTRGRGIHLVCNRSDLENDDNLAVRAARAFNAAAGLEGGVEISLGKEIPVQGGLGGGSSDAAAVLVALNELTDHALGAGPLAAVAADLGSDVPFFLYGGTARVTGRGEEVVPLDARGGFTYLIYYPGFGISTAQVYKNLGLKLTYNLRSDKVLCAKLREGDLETASKCFFNRLEETAFALDGRLATAKAQMQRCAGDSDVVLCGSGSCLFSAFTDADRAQGAYKQLRGYGAGEVFLARTIRGSGSTGSAKGVERGDL